MATRSAPVALYPKSRGTVRLASPDPHAAPLIRATAEGAAFGIKAGLDPARMIEVLNQSTGVNSATGAGLSLQGPAR